MPDLIYYAVEETFRKGIYHRICDPDGDLWMPSWTKNYNGMDIAHLISRDWADMVEERCITMSGKLLDKGYQECLSMGLTPPMEAMA
jgi:hypothetical protein